MTKPELAEKCREVILSAAKENNNLWGLSVLDLCADSFPEEDLQDLKLAISKSFEKITITDKFSRRIQEEILMYERTFNV